MVIARRSLCVFEGQLHRLRACSCLHQTKSTDLMVPKETGRVAPLKDVTVVQLSWTDEKESCIPVIPDILYWESIVFVIPDIVNRESILLCHSCDGRNPS